MESILTGTLSGFAVLFVSSLAWLSYNHPSKFRKIKTPINIAVFSVACGVFGYDYGISTASTALEGSWGKLQSLSIPFYWFYIAIAFYVYTIFLDDAVSTWRDGDGNGGDGGDD